MNIEELERCISELKDTDLKLFERTLRHYKKIIILGNGGSNAIAQHIAQDYTKVLDKKAICFADASRLTCYFNDYGKDNAYYEFLKDFTEPETLVILISSSGESDNIINCGYYCRYHKVNFIILTGFEETNSLRTEFGRDVLLDIWVNSKEYGVVELTHEAFLHSVC